MGTHLVACGQMHLRSPAGQDQLQMNLVMLKAQGKYSYIFTKMRYIAIGCGEVRHRVYFMQQLPLVSHGAEPTECPTWVVSMWLRHWLVEVEP